MPVGSASQRLARVVNEAFAPVVVVAAVLLLVAVHASDSAARGLLLGVVAVSFVGGLPYLVLLLQIRAGRLGDRQLSRREERPLMLGVVVGCVVAGLVVLRLLEAPRELFAAVAAMVGGVVVALAVSTFWKVSVHTACAAGAVVVLAAVISPLVWLLAPLLVLVGWARVSVSDHTVGQAVAGVVVGAAVAAAAMAWLR